MTMSPLSMPTKRNDHASNVTPPSYDPTVFDLADAEKRMGKDKGTEQKAA